MHRLFKLGGFCFAADHPDTLVFPPNFLRFETKDVQPAYFYTLRFVKSIPNPVGVCTAVREDLIVYRDGEKESRLLGIQGMLGFYALYRELDDTHAEVMIAEDCRGCLVFDPVFASLFALERRMLQKDSFILHSAYIRHRGRAILFSAPSGTGKSTQASLWAQYAGAEIINGDRALLQKVQDCWMARGWLVCGTSGICQNADARLSAVVLLRQAKKNAVRRLSRGEAFLRLYGQVTVNRWDQAESARVLDAVEALLRRVPAFLLDCTISEEASTACMRRCTPRPWRRPSACAHAYRCCGAARVHRRDPFRNGSGRRDGNAGVRQQYGAVSHPRAGRCAACKMHVPAKARGDRAVSAVRRAVRSAPRLARDEKRVVSPWRQPDRPRGPRARRANLLPCYCRAPQG